MSLLGRKPQAIVLEALIVEARRTVRKCERAAVAMTQKGELQLAAGPARLARYARWRLEQLVAIQAGADLPMPTYAAWRDRAGGQVEQQRLL